MLLASPVAGQQTHQHAQNAQTPKEPIPPITDADRKAAFPDGLGGHAVHGDHWHYFVLFDQLELQNTGSAKLENTTWIGGDVNRLWFRTDLESDDGDVESAGADVLWGHSFSRWWDIVGGIRQDVRPGDPQTWAAVGIQGLAPYWFEVEATGYVGSDGRTRARFEVEYELLLTNRVILQPVAELEFYGKGDPGRGVGAGLSSLETGLRLRYEIRRELAPYVGITWDRKLFGTADLAREAHEDISTVRLSFGLRTWF